MFTVDEAFAIKNKSLLIIVEFDISKLALRQLIAKLSDY